MKKKPTSTIQSAHGVDPSNGVPNWLSAIAAYPMSDLIASGIKSYLIPELGN